MGAPDDMAFLEEIPKMSVGKFSKKLRAQFENYKLPTA